MSDVTRILSAIEQGDPHAAELLLPLVYEEVRRLAAQKLAGEKPGQPLQGHLAADRLRLLGHEDQPHAALADLLHQLVGADDHARAPGEGLVDGAARGAAAVNAAARLVGVQELVYPRPQLGVAAAGRQLAGDSALAAPSAGRRQRGWHWRRRRRRRNCWRQAQRRRNWPGGCGRPGRIGGRFPTRVAALLPTVLLFFSWGILRVQVQSFLTLTYRTREKGPSGRLPFAPPGRICSRRPWA
jgi:hypothetical protein